MLIPEGEGHRTRRPFGVDSYDALVEQPLRPRRHLIALGGRVIGDITALRAAANVPARHRISSRSPRPCWRRWIASVGGKTAVNHEQGKNLIGAFYQPGLVGHPT